MATRGRPKTDNIFRFNVATDLTDNKRFIRFKRCLGTDERVAYLTLVRFFNFVAANYALTGRISVNFRDDNSREEAEVIADFCWWDGDAQLLLTALHESGFVEDDGKVHEWFDNQPYATKKLRDRELPPISDTINDGNSPPIEERREKRRESNTAKSDAPPAQSANGGQAVDKSHRNGTPPPSPGQRPSSDTSLIEEIDLFLDELGEILTLNENDRRGIRWDIMRHGGTDDLSHLLDQLRAARSDRRLGCKPGISNPVGWIRKHIQDLTEQDSRAG